MTARIRNFYANGITSQGFYSLYQSSIKDLERVFILKGAPGTGKSSLVKDVADILLENGLDLELIHSPKDNNSLDGVLIPKLKLGIVIGNPPFVIDPRYPGVVEETILFDDSLDLKTLAEHKHEIISLVDKIDNTYQKSLDHFAQAKNIHLEREALYVQEMKFEKANEITESLMERIFFDRNEDRKANQRHMFFGAATPEGVINFIDNLTEEVDTRIILKGRPGSGKSTMLTKLVNEASLRGFDTEVYQCGFEPNSLDMVIIPELKFAVLDGTAPHPIEPTRGGDEVLDMYQLCFAKDVDTDSTNELQEIDTRYKQQTTVAIQCLAEAKELHDQLKQIYTDAMDFEKVMERKKCILDSILS